MSATPITERVADQSKTAEAHPCFSAGHAATNSRLHLPVAPRCNVQCRFCDRAFDCVNESRPGVTASLLTPDEAVDRVDRLRDRLPGLSVVGIAGPGDPLANPRETFETFRLVRSRHPDLTLCLATNGLALPAVIDDIVELGVSHLTVTVNAINPEVGKGVYAWVRSDGRARTGTEAAELLWERQKEGITEAVAHGLTVKINTILIPGVNDGEVESIARQCSALGAHFMNLIPLLPVKGTALESVGEPSRELIATRRSEAKRYLPQLAHCKRCRADAAGLLGADLNVEELSQRQEALVSREKALSNNTKDEVSSDSISPRRRSFLAAVASREGLLVNRHLGEADRLFVFRVEGDGTFDTHDIRPLPEAGGGDARWDEVAKLLSDCEALFVAGIGARPRRLLEIRGIAIHVVEGLVSEALSALAAGKDLSFLNRRAPGCGSGCSGSARNGCGCG